MREQLIKDEKALRAIMIAGMIWTWKDERYSVRQKASLPSTLHLELWMHLFVNCGMDAKEADDWISRQLTLWWRRLKWLPLIPLLSMLIIGCPLGALSWLGAPRFLLVPLHLGLCLLWYALFPSRVLFFEYCIQQYWDGMNWSRLLEKCRRAFPFRLSVQECMLILLVFGVCLLLLHLLIFLLSLVFGG